MLCHINWISLVPDHLMETDYTGYLENIIILGRRTVDNDLVPMLYDLIQIFVSQWISIQSPDKQTTTQQQMRRKEKVREHIKI